MKYSDNTATNAAMKKIFSQDASPSDGYTLEQVLNDYRDIHLLLNSQWPIESNNERVFARMMKLMEEVGEFSNEVLTKMGLQRQSKIDAFEEEHLEDELADVFGSVLLLAIELDIDIQEVMRRKVALTLDRLQQEIENGSVGDDVQVDGE